MGVKELVQKLKNANDISSLCEELTGESEEEVYTLLALLLFKESLRNEYIKDENLYLSFQSFCSVTRVHPTLWDKEKDKVALDVAIADFISRGGEEKAREDILIGANVFAKLCLGQEVE